jgi:hypothetical protein
VLSGYLATLMIISTKKKKRNNYSTLEIASLGFANGTKPRSFR